MSLALGKQCIIFCVVALSAEALNGSAEAETRVGSGNSSVCCGSALGGTCADGSYGTPCCGQGSCNAFCCACDNGCRAPLPPNPPTPIPPKASTTPLNQWPMIMSHDAATSYYASKSCTLSKALENYVMTQVPGTFTTQLDCGTRAFDLRPRNDGGKLIAHHGAVNIAVNVIDMLNEIVAWASINPNEFVLVYGSHCDGDNCEQMFVDALTSAKIPSIQCGEVADLTLGEAMKRGLLPDGGGSVLAVWGCMEENYVPSITCYSEIAEKATLKAADDDTSSNHIVNEPRSLWSCWGADAQKAFDPLWSYLEDMTDGRGTKQDQLWMAQAHWQYDASSIAQGELELSCILKDSSAAGVNQKLADKISQGLFPHINILEVDDVCGGHGPDLLKSLRSRFTFDIAMSDQAIVI